MGGSAWLHRGLATPRGIGVLGAARDRACVQHGAGVLRVREIAGHARYIARGMDPYPRLSPLRRDDSLPVLCNHRAPRVP